MIRNSVSEHTTLAGFTVGRSKWPLFQLAAGHAACDESRDGSPSRRSTELVSAASPDYPRAIDRAYSIHRQGPPEISLAPSPNQLLTKSRPRTAPPSADPVARQPPWRSRSRCGERQLPRSWQDCLLCGPHPHHTARIRRARTCVSAGRPRAPGTAGRRRVRLETMCGGGLHGSMRYCAHAIFSGRNCCCAQVNKNTWIESGSCPPAPPGGQNPDGHSNSRPS